MSSKVIPRFRKNYVTKQQVSILASALVATFGFISPIRRLVAMISGLSVRIHKFLTNALNGQPLSKEILINDKSLLVTWTPRAQDELDRRTRPLYVEMELYFSCMVKKYIHFLDQPRSGEFVNVNEKLAVYFRPVTSTGCSMDLAADLGRQPEIELHNKTVSRMVPKRVFVDFKNRGWIGEYWL